MMSAGRAVEESSFGWMGRKAVTWAAAVPGHSLLKRAGCANTPVSSLLRRSQRAPASKRAPLGQSKVADHRTRPLVAALNTIDPAM